MSKEQFAQYRGTMETVFSGNNVFLTLYNPNYAGVFLTMVVWVFFVLCATEKERKKKAWYGMGLLAGLLLLWFTYSRSVFVSLLTAGSERCANGRKDAVCNIQSRCPGFAGIGSVCCSIRKALLLFVISVLSNFILDFTIQFHSPIFRICSCAF